MTAGANSHSQKKRDFADTLQVPLLGIAARGDAWRLPHFFSRLRLLRLAVVGARACVALQTRQASLDSKYSID